VDVRKIETHTMDVAFRTLHQRMLHLHASVGSRALGLDAPPQLLV